MPNDGSGRGTFDSDKDDAEPYKYEVVKWVKSGEHPRRRSGRRLTEKQLPEVDFMVVKVIKEDDDETTFDTLWGPFDDWDFVEGFLGYDYGAEGSLAAGATGSR